MSRNIIILTICLFFSLSGKTEGQKKVLHPSAAITIEGSSEILAPGDSVVLRGNVYGLDVAGPPFSISQYCRLSGNTYRFRLKGITHPVIISITYYRNGSYWGAIPGGYPAEAGDNILIKDQQNIRAPFQQYFSGQGAEKYSCRNYFIQRSNILYARYPHFSLLNTERVNAVDSLCRENMAYLEKRKTSLSRYAYCYLKNAVLTEGEYRKYEALNMTGSTGSFPFENALFQTQIRNRAKDTRSGMEYSYDFYYYLGAKFQYDSCTAVHRKENYRKFYFYIKENYRGRLREQLVTLLFVKKDFNEKRDCMDDALEYVFYPPFRQLILNIRIHSGKGVAGYNFSLPDTSRRMHRLSDYRNSVVVMDFWYTGCGNCKQLAPFLAKVEQSFTGKKVIFLTVSIDKDFSVWKRSVLQGEYTSVTTLNLFTNGAGGEASVITRNNIHSYPTLLLIDRHGKMWNSPIDPRLDGGSDLTAQIDRLLQETHY